MTGRYVTTAAYAGRSVTTAVVQIGNSDDRLCQAEWAAFVSVVQVSAGLWAKQIHFEGFSAPHQVWQNACWVFEIYTDHTESLRESLVDVARRYRQDSIALTIGDTEFVKATSSP